MLTLDLNLKLPKHVVFTFVDKDAILLNTQDNQYFGLDNVGARLWELVTQGKTLRESYNLMVGEYDVEPELLEKDLLELIADLRENGLVKIVEE